MDDWKIIKRSTKAGEETVTRSLRLPKELDAYCTLQGNASDFIRELIKRHMQVRGIDPRKELTEDEEDLHQAINEFYARVKNTLSIKDIEAGITYPSPDKITDAQIDEIFDYVAKHWEDFDLVDQCMHDKQLARTVYARIRDYELVQIQREKKLKEQEEERKQRLDEEWSKMKEKEREKRNT
jgi:truncated hemoglobin YjbI